MTIWDWLAGRRPAHDGEEFFSSAEIIDKPRASIRADTLRFAGMMVAGFTDDELVKFLDRPAAARTTLLTPRVRLVREGLLVRVGTLKNERGNPVNRYKSVAYIDGPAFVPAKRETYAQLRRKLTTAQLEIANLRNQLSNYEKADA